MIVVKKIPRACSFPEEAVARMLHEQAREVPGKDVSAGFGSIFLFFIVFDYQAHFLMYKRKYPVGEESSHYR